MGVPPCANWWSGWTRDSSELEMSFNRYRDIALDVEGRRLTGTLLDELDLQSVDLLRYLCGTPMTLGWYYAFTPIKPVTISNEQSVFAADVWRRSTNAYEEWALQAFPVRDREIP